MGRGGPRSRFPRDMLSYKFFLLLPYVVQFLLPLILWRSPRNIVFILQIPMFLTAYPGGVFFLMDEVVSELDIPPENIFYLIMLLSLGTYFYVLTYIYNFKKSSKVEKWAINKVNYINAKPIAEKNTIVLMVFSLAFLTILFYAYSFMKMGFVPMFTEEPMLAKFFAEKYQETYRPVAHYFRMAVNLTGIITPLLVIYLFIKKNIVLKLVDILLLLAIFIFAILTMRRGIIAWSLLYLLLLYAVFYRNGKYIKYAVAFYIIIFMFGSMLNNIFGYVIGSADEIRLTSIFRGTPDIFDLLWFWDSFLKTNYEFSYGRTIYGGLIPYHYEWNPSVLSKLVIGADPALAGSGGFRLPFQVEGYYTFGVAGTILWSIFCGYIDSLELKISKYAILNRTGNFYSFFFAMLLINTVIMAGRNMLGMRIDTVFIIFINSIILFSLFYRLKL